MLDKEGKMNQHVMAKLDIGHRLLFGKEHMEKLLGVVVVGGVCVCDEELLPGAISSATERDKILVCY